MDKWEEMRNKYEWFDFVYKRYQEKFPDTSPENFLEDMERYNQIPTFKANENIHQIMTNYQEREDLPDLENNYVKSSDIVTPGSHWIMRMIVQYYLTRAFSAMKVDLEDPNVSEQVLGKGTPGRIAKMFVGADPKTLQNLAPVGGIRNPLFPASPTLIVTTI